MAQEESPHLTDGEVMALSEGSAGGAAARHVETCADCRERVAGWREARALMARAVGPEARAGGACPLAEELANYAVGGPANDRWDAVTAHVAECGRCAGILRDSLEEPAEERTGPVAVAPGRGVASRQRPASPPGWKYAVAAALLLAVVGSAVVWWIGRRASGPSMLLAKAYTEARPFVYRLPDDGYAPVRQQRGGGSAFDRPEALLSAEAAIRRELAADPRAAELLALKGRAELLEHDYEAAIESLTRATEANDRDAGALTDLAVAYAVRGEAEKRNIDSGHAMELFLQALRLRPGDPRTEFNLALTYEKLWLIDEAIEAWRQFLRGNPPEGWRREAREHLAEMEKIKAEKKQADDRVLGDPAQFLAAYSEGAAFDPLPWFDVFWTEWLPKARADGAAAAAARRIAAGFARFGEFSLVETLEAPAGAAKDAGLALLAKAIGLNRGGHPGEALEVAREAAGKLDAAGLRAAAALARTQVVYATRWTDRYAECQETARALLGSLGPRYPWLEGNTRLDYSSCLLLWREDGAARKEIDAAQRQLTAAGLWPMALRADQFAVAVDGETGNYAPVWEKAPEGLRRYWTSQASSYRAEGFQAFLQAAATDLGWRECSAIFYRGAIRFAHEAGNAEMEAANHSQLAELLQQMGDYAGERRELDAVDRILGGLGESEDGGVLRWEADLLRVEADVASGAAGDALPELNRLAAAAGEDTVQRIDLEQTRGLAWEARGETARAEAAFQRAIELAEKRAQTMKSWVERIPPMEAVAASYRHLTLMELMQHHDPAAALATWRRFRPMSGAARRAIAMALLPAGIAIWKVDGGNVQARLAEAPAEELRRASEQFLSLCASPGSSGEEIRRVGNRLYRGLLRPELEKLGPGTIVLSTESWLAEIPFGALTDDAGEYLCRRFRFVEGYGPPRDTPAGTVTAASAAVIVEAPSAAAPGQPLLPVLPAAEREAAETAARFAHATASREATVEWLAENAPRAEVFHFSGHGWANGGNGALILPPGPDHEARFVTSANLARQNWSRCQLAVLSACLTAAGETRGAVNNQSLVQALLSAGARRVVAARWSIDSEATRALMQSFYAGLASGKSVPEALFGAEADVAAVRGWSHPYYWAGFDVFGAA